MNKNMIKEFSKKYLALEIVIAFLYLIFIALSLIGPYLMEYFIDEVLPSKDPGNVVKFVLAFIGIYLLMSVIAILIKKNVVGLENNIVTEIRTKMFDNVVKQPLSFYQQHQFGAVNERLVRDTAVVHSIWGYLFPSIFSSVISFVATMVIIIRRSWIIAAFSVVSIGIYLLVFKLYNEKLRSLYLETRGDADQIGASMTDAWNGSREIKSFRLENLITGKFNRINLLLKKHNMNMAIKQEFSNQFMSLATTLGTLTTLCVGGLMVMRGQMTVGILVALQAYVAKLYKPAENIADMAVDYKKYQVNIQRMAQLYYLEGSEQVDSDAAGSISGNIVFDKVNFAYNEKSVLKDVSFETPDKGVIAIVGKSGAGKTTIMNILMKFINPSSGEIKIGDRNYSTCTPGEVRNSISLASQDSYLFNMSIMDNIRLGNPSVSEDRLKYVIELLEIDKFASSFPKGMDTVIAEMGKNISGGQVQRIAIARALVKDTPILILDEATSNVDSNSETIIQSALEKIQDNKLIILISHRLSSLKKAQAIYVLEDGAITQSGSFAELLSEDGAFKQLFDEQVF